MSQGCYSQNQPQNHDFLRDAPEQRERHLYETAKGVGSNHLKTAHRDADEHAARRELNKEFVTLRPVPQCGGDPRPLVAHRSELEKVCILGEEYVRSR